MKLLNNFSAHPASVGETYAGHCLKACMFGARLLLAGLACLVHAFLPFLFVRTASECIAQLHASLSARHHMPHSRADALRRNKASHLPQ
jgi:hypothetical protein